MAEDRTRERLRRLRRELPSKPHPAPVRPAEPGSRAPVWLAQRLRARARRAAAETGPLEAPTPTDATVGEPAGLARGTNDHGPFLAREALECAVFLRRDALTTA